MTRGIFVTGTDTGVGKTVVCAAALARLRTDGVDAVPMKPIQTGCEPRAGGLVAPDLEFALQAVDLRPPPDERELMSPYRFEPACSPHLAAAMASARISIERVTACFNELAARHDTVVVEGAGGVLVPIGQGRTMLDLMIALRLPVLLVARPGLGTINHTLLSLREIRRTGLHPLGVVFNESIQSPRGMVEEDNPRIVAELAASTQTPMQSDVAPSLGEGRHADKRRPYGIGRAEAVDSKAAASVHPPAAPLGIWRLPFAGDLRQKPLPESLCDPEWTREMPTTQDLIDER
jgi:dethiobiotin synthetase